MVWLGVLAALSALQAVHGILNTTSVIVQRNGWSIYPCWQVDHREPNLEPSMMGLWYVIEIIQHRNDPKHLGTEGSDICPKLNLFKTGPKNIKLIWHERAGDVHYDFNMADEENSGFWLVWSRQNGSMLNKAYEQFAGSVQVIDAQPDRMVLTFCSNNRTHYSVIMVRNITVPHDTHSSHKTLTGYGLPEVSVRLTCRGPHLMPDSATKSIPGLVVILSSLLLAGSRMN